jgi:hypothetical protein
MPDDFVMTTLEPMFSSRPPDRIFVLYSGAPSVEPIDGMFSFVSCMPAETARNGFARPRVDSVPGLSAANKQAVAFNSRIANDEVPVVWRRLADTIVAQGLSLGVHVALP